MPQIRKTKAERKSDRAVHLAQRAVQRKGDRAARKWAAYLEQNALSNWFTFRPAVGPAQHSVRFTPVSVAARRNAMQYDAARRKVAEQPELAEVT